MESVWKNIRQVTKDKMLWFSSTRTKCLADGGVFEVSHFHFSLTVVLSIDPRDEHENLIWIHLCFSLPLIYGIYYFNYRCIFI